tara:strand:+ start:48332 stop:48499 length:168 start_codon:yes stop_codon:yes gene_type:complete
VPQALRVNGAQTGFPVIEVAMVLLEKRVVRVLGETEVLKGLLVETGEKVCRDLLA